MNLRFLTNLIKKNLKRFINDNFKRLTVQKELHKLQTIVKDITLRLFSSTNLYSKQAMEGTNSNFKFMNSEMEFKEFEPRFKSAKTRFKLSAGLNLETFDTILSGTSHI